MGNVPISCCRSKTPRNQRNHTSHRANSLSSGGYQRNLSNNQYSSSNDYHHDQRNPGKFTDKQLAKHGEEVSYLQHISEREPDDSETDPSSNPLNRPIFATRSKTSSSTSAKQNRLSIGDCKDNLSTGAQDNNRKQQPATSPTSTGACSQDNGYNSNPSNNITHPFQDYDRGHIAGSLESTERTSCSSISRQQDSQVNKPESDKKDGDELLPPLRNKSSQTRDSEQNNIREETRLLSPIRDDSVLGGRGFMPNSMPKASSCSTIYVDDSTISQPDLEQTIKCVSLAIYYHIRSRTSDSSVEIFDESIHPLTIPLEKNDGSKSSQLTLDKIEPIIGEGEDLNSTQSDLRSAEALGDPDQETIYSFVKTLFKAAQLTSEYAITTLVYIERLMTYAEINPSPKTWRRMFLGAILLSSKVWEDQAVWNVDYAQILDDITVEDINELERQFLELIQFNMNVPSSVYAKYYFHLRTLAFKNGLIRHQRLMTIGKAKTLEAMSRVDKNDWHNSPIHRKSSPKLNRYASLERSRMSGLAKAVLM